MKKILLLMALAALALPGFAQTRVGEYDFDEDDFIPGCFTNGGSYQYFFNRQSDDAAERVYDSIWLINNNLQVVKTFSNRFLINNCSKLFCFDMDELDREAEMYVPFTQSVFNNDDLWEFVVETGEDSTFYYGELVYLRPTYQIVQENGNVLYSFAWIDEVPENAEATNHGSDMSMYLVRWNGIFYAVVDYYWTMDGEREGKTVLYRFNQSTQNIQRVGEDLPMRVFPTPAASNQEITVELGDNTTASEVEVLNTLGQTIQRVAVQPGQKEVKINTAKMGKGLHFVHSRNHKVAKIVIH